MQKNKRKVAVIGGGISGLSAACYAAKNGFEVGLYEKNSSLGGRARQFVTENGYTFDMGPSWYWMPDIIEDFFRDFGYEVSDFYTLKSLNPQFEVVFNSNSIEIPERFEDMINLFESLEKGAGKRLVDFMKDAEVKYDVGMKQFVTKPCLSWTEFVAPTIAKSALKLDLFTNFRSFVTRYFKHPQLQQIMEFPVIFLGAAPQNIPALYSLMNFGGYRLGTHYPQGGFFELIKAMEKIALSLGVNIHLSSAVETLQNDNNRVKCLVVNNEMKVYDEIIASSDYAHTETLLESEDLKNYTENYWKNRVFAPSCLIYYLGIKGKLPNLHHHTLFFDEDMDKHVDEIYNSKEWPTKPLFYACCPSKTDPHVAPVGSENLFLLMPISINLEDSEAQREKYFLEMIARLEKKTGVNDLVSRIEFKKSYCVNDFKKDYNAYGGNAYGLANTLKQTAILKPSIRNKKLKNLWYTGQLTVPGPGVPPSLISGKIVANQLQKESL